MILRRVIEHVRTQNWLAVGIDFLIVVVGVFIGIQLGNLNEAREARKTELELIGRLTIEFEEIAAALDGTLEAVPRYLDATGVLIEVARGDSEFAEERMKEAVYLSFNLGRPPLRSATYQQLVASGDLKLLRDDETRSALTRYHQSVDQQNFLYPKTIDQLIRVPDFRDVPVRSAEERLEFLQGTESLSRIRYDLDALREAEGHLEGLYVLQLNLLRAARLQSDYAGAALNELKGGER
ncbi:hypothetical protein HK107_09360 [Parvularcula sp. ZS-1/3]|uniref:Uncharacterized protein n=1 Tax=Parvularcula mediterranea TaxID=2732508 RepID=A0A7Y3RMX8_9PROT|nr:hypothetical protein [Parvularcula mediterranea]NNU16526.1 hypothetical protein [Parvularcula mediterranea]